MSYRSATDVDVASRGLVMAGTKPISSFEDGTVEADVARLLYEDIVVAALTSTTWRFAMTQKQVNRIETPPKGRGEAAFQIPADCLIVRALTLDHKNPATFERFEDQIYTWQTVSEASIPVLEYSRRVATSEWPAYFVIACQHLLASEFAIAIGQNEQLSNIHAQKAEVLLRNAKSIDAQGSHELCDGYQEVYQKPENLMGKYRTLQTAFNGGEYDSKLRGRSDIKAYFQGCLKVRNFSLLSHGGFIRRYESGLGANVGADGRLIPFEFSATEANLLYLRDGGFADVYSLDGILQQTLSGGEWTLAQLDQIKYEQRGNAIFLAHNQWQTKILRRTDLNTFTLMPYEFYTIPGTGKKMQPYSNVNQDKTIQMTVSSYDVNVDVTLASNLDFFTAEMVGTWITLGDGGYGHITAFTDAQNVTYFQLAPPARALLTDPLQVTKGSSIGTVTMVEHGFVEGQKVFLKDFTETGGIEAETINRQLVVIQIVDEHRFQVDFSQQVDPDNPSAPITLTSTWDRETGFPPLANSGDGWWYYNGGIFGVSSIDNTSASQSDGLRAMTSGTTLTATSLADPNAWASYEFTAAPYIGVAQGQNLYSRVNATKTAEGSSGSPSEVTTPCTLAFSTPPSPPGSVIEAEDTYTGGGLQAKVEYLGPLADWRVQSFSDVMGWPGVVALHQERLFFAATIREPDTLFSTRIGDLDVFDLGDGYPSDSIQVTLDAGRVNEIRHIVSSRHLQIFTNDAEFYVAAPSENVTPENITIRKQTPYGSSHVRATEFDGATMFFQDSGRAVREFLFTDREFAYNARNIALMSQHLIRQPTEVAAIYGSSARPEKYMFIRNDDGTLAVLHMIREEEMIGWALWNTDGTYESIAVTQRRIFYTVQRDGQFFLEEFDQSLGLTLDGTEEMLATADASVWGPSTFYAGKTVGVMQKGFYEGEYLVDASGFIQANSNGWSDVKIGYNFQCEMETMPAVVTLPDGSLVGVPLRLTRVIVDMENTLSLHVDGQRLDMRNTLGNPASPSGSAVNERVEFQLNTVDRQPTVTITQEYPFPCAIYSMTIEVAW